MCVRERESPSQARAIFPSPILIRAQKYMTSPRMNSVPRTRKGRRALVAAGFVVSSQLERVTINVKAVGSSLVPKKETERKKCDTEWIKIKVSYP